MSTVLIGGGTSTLDGLSVSGTTTLSTAPAVTTAQSMVRLQFSNGYGSTNTKIRRYTGTTVSQGSDITYADSATLGASLTINTSGVYSMTISDTGTASSTVGISLNTTQPAVAISALTYAERLVHNTGNGTNPVSASVTVYIAAGGVIRPHTDGTAASNNAYADFTIVRIS